MIRYDICMFDEGNTIYCSSFDNELDEVIKQYCIDNKLVKFSDAFTVLDTNILLDELDGDNQIYNIIIEYLKSQGVNLDVFFELWYTEEFVDLLYKKIINYCNKEGDVYGL